MSETDYESIARELDAMAEGVDGTPPIDRFDVHHLAGKCEGLRLAAQTVRRAAKDTESKSMVAVGAAEDIASALRRRADEERGYKHASPGDLRFADLLDRAARALMPTSDTEYQSKDLGWDEHVASARRRIDQWPDWKRRAAADLRVTPRDTEHQSVARDPDAWLIEHDGISTATCSAKIAKTASRDGGTVRPLYLADDTECRSVDRSAIVEAIKACQRHIVECVGDEVVDVYSQFYDDVIKAAGCEVLPTDCGSVDERGQ